MKTHAARPVIQTEGAPPDRHAERIVTEMMAWMKGQQPTLLMRDVAAALGSWRSMETPDGQQKAAQRLREDCAGFVFSVDLTPNTRGRFRLAFNSWMVTLGPRLAVNLIELRAVKDFQRVPDTDARIPMQVTHHACVRLAQRANVKTVRQMIHALQMIWEAARPMLAEPREHWATPPDAGWLVPLKNGSFMVVTTNAGDELLVKTVLSPDMTIDPCRLWKPTTPPTLNRKPDPLKTVLALGVALPTAPAHAETLNCDTFSTMKTCRGPNGYTSTEDTFGTMTRGRDDAGNSWTTDKFGDRTTTRFQPSPGNY
jgi:hypothetical protein